MHGTDSWQQFSWCLLTCSTGIWQFWFRKARKLKQQRLPHPWCIILCSVSSTSAFLLQRVRRVLHLSCCFVFMRLITTSFVNLFELKTALFSERQISVFSFVLPSFIFFLSLLFFSILCSLVSLPLFVLSFLYLFLSFALHFSSTSTFLLLFFPSLLSCEVERASIASRYQGVGTEKGVVFCMC
jgi:hypothetical protein